MGNVYIMPKPWIFLFISKYVVSGAWGYKNITAHIFQAMRVSNGDNVNKFNFYLTLIGKILLFNKSCKLDKEANI